MRRAYLYDNSTRLHESNYGKLVVLLPALRRLPVDAIVRSSRRPGLSIRITESSAYTTAFDLTIESGHGSGLWLPNLGMTVRVYHDARVAEVVKFERKSRFQPKYRYPNPEMHQRDEKQQINRFLAETLDYCFQAGIIFHQDAFVADLD